MKLSPQYIERISIIDLMDFKMKEARTGMMEDIKESLFTITEREE